MYFIRVTYFNENAIIDKMYKCISLTASREFCNNRMKDRRTIVCVLYFRNHKGRKEILEIFN